MISNRTRYLIAGSESGKSTLAAKETFRSDKQSQVLALHDLMIHWPRLTLEAVPEIDQNILDKS